MITRTALACNDVSEELNGIRQLLRILALPPNGERWDGVLLQVNCYGRELQNLTSSNLQFSHTCQSQSPPSNSNYQTAKINKRIKIVNYLRRRGRRR